MIIIIIIILSHFPQRPISLPTPYQGCLRSNRFREWRRVSIGLGQGRKFPFLPLPLPLPLAHVYSHPIFISHDRTHFTETHATRRLQLAFLKIQFVVVFHSFTREGSN